MSQVVKLKRTAVEGKVPNTSNIELGELAINTYDGRIFFEKDNGTPTIQQVVTTNSQTTGSLNILGTVTASYFVGNGSQLTNLPNPDVSQVATVTSSFDNQSSISVNHNFDTKNVIISVYQSNDTQIIPSSVTLTNNNTATIGLSSAQSGYVVVAKGGHIVSGSIIASASFTELTNLPNGLVSGSSQLTSSYDSRYVLSGSITQTTWDNIANKPLGIISGSSQLTASYDIRYALSGSNQSTFNRTVESYTATEGQTIFTTTGSASVGNVDVYINGFKLLTSDFDVTNSNTITLTTGSSAGEQVEINLYNAFAGTYLTTQDLNGFISSSAQVEFNSVNNTPFSQSATEVTTTKSIVPTTSTIDLGTAEKPFRDLYLSSASLYIDGQQVISSNASELVITTDVGQSIKLLEAGADDIILQTDTGNIELKGTVELLSGKKIIDSGGTQILFGNSIGITGSISLSGTVDGVDVSQLKSDFDGVQGKSLISGSSQVSFNGITDKPSLVSGSSQILTLVSIDEDTMVSNSDTKVPTQQSVKNYVDTKVADLVSGSPETLDTLNELATALGNDPNFATTVSNQIGGKVSQSLQVIAGNGLTGGGDLTTNRTLDVVSANNGIIVNSDNIQLDTTSTTFTSGVKTKLNIDGVVSGSSQITLSSTSGYGSVINQAVLTSSLPTFAGVTLTGALNGTSASFKVNADRNLAIKYDTNITISGQADSGGPESLRIYADTFRIYTATTAVGLTERFTISNTGAATFSSSVTVNGTGNPALDVQGTAIIRGNGSAYTTHYFTTAAANVAVYNQYDASGNLINRLSAGGDTYFNGGGNFGVGLDAPSSKFEIRGSTSSPQFRISRSEQTNQGLSVQAGGGVTTFNSYDGTDTVFGSYVFNSTKGSTALERVRITTDAVTTFQITGATATNDNYPILRFKGGTYPDADSKYPYIQLGNGGLALSLFSGTSTTFNNPSQISLNNGVISFSTAAASPSPVSRMEIDSLGYITTDPTSATNGGLIARGIEYSIKTVGSLSGYTQGAIAVSSGTDSSPSARGQGIFYFNEGNDITWYNGGLYNATDRWDICRKSGTSAIDASTAQTAYTLFNLNSSGAAYNATGTWGTISSDQRLKENIVDATSKLNDVMSLKVRNFNYIGKEEKYIGFIAQELEEVFPSLVTTNDMREFDRDGNVVGGLEDTKGVKVGMDFAILVKAIQELKAENDALKLRLDALEQQ